MKKLLFSILFFIPSLGFAYSTTFNPWTGELDIIGSSITTINLPSNVALLDSTQTFTASQEFSCQVTFSSAVVLGGTAGQIGDVYTSSGAGVAPYWSPAKAGLLAVNSVTGDYTTTSTDTVVAGMTNGSTATIRLHTA